MATKPASTTVRRSLQEWEDFCKQVQSSSAVNFNETPEEQLLRKKKALKDYNYFVRTYFKTLTDCDCATFQITYANHVLKNNNQFAIAEWPREHAKSMHCDIFIPMWLLAHGQLTGLMLVGKNEDDAANLLSDIQAQLQFNELFTHDWGDQYNFGHWQEGDFTTRSGIRFLALGRGQSPRGVRKNQLRPNVAILDDIDDDEIVQNPRRVKKVVESIFGALYFALMITDWRILVAGNRIHPQSILAHLVGDTQPGTPKREGIYHNRVVAIDEHGKPAWPQRYTLKQLNDKIKGGGMRARTEMFHESHVEGTIFQEKHFGWKPMPPATWDKYRVIVGYFDPSFENKPTSDTKAVRVWGLDADKEERHCLSSFVQRCELHKCFEFMSAMDEKCPPGVGIIWYVEKQFFNRPIQDALYRHNEARKRAGKKPLMVITDSRTKENKFTRIVKMEPVYSMEKVFFNQDEFHSPGMIEGNNQLKSIEPGYNSPDDSPDADEGAWYYLEQHLPTRSFSPRIAPPRNSSGW